MQFSTIAQSAQNSIENGSPEYTHWRVVWPGVWHSNKTLQTCRPIMQKPSLPQTYIGNVEIELDLDKHINK